jgi:YD repeat-containing protein
VLAGAGQTLGTTLYGYDALHRLTREQRPGANAVHFAYDQAGNREASGEQDAGGGWVAPYYVYEYDETGGTTHRLTDVKLDGAASAHALRCHTGMVLLYGMKKTLHIDEALLRDARSASGARTDTETVRLGLEALIRQGAYERLRALRGKEPRAGGVRRRRERPSRSKRTAA